MAALWSRQLISEAFDEVLTCRKERFPNGRTPTKLFALFSFWADNCILYNFHIIYRLLHRSQKNCWLRTKEEPVTDWMMIVSHETGNSVGLNRFCFAYPQTWKHWSVETDSTYFILCCFIFNLMWQRICKEDEFGLFCPVEEENWYTSLVGTWHLAEANAPQEVNEGYGFVFFSHLPS